MDYQHGTMVYRALHSSGCFGICGCLATGEKIMMDVKTRYENEIDRLLDQRNLLIAKTKPVQHQISEIDTDLAELELKLSEVVKAPRVSAHAVIRYLERVHNFDFEDQREKLLTPTVLMAMKMGSGKVKCDGYSLVLKGNTVITVVD